jgi:Natural resistance-associated macrophage protein
LFCAWKVRRGEPGRPPVTKDVRELVRKMSRENPAWGALRIYGELLKPGIDIGETSVSKYMVRRRKAPSQTWRTFLKAARRTSVLPGRFLRFFSDLGPGLITGAAVGYTPLWTALFSFPSMAAIQIMCDRLGIATGLGLAGVIRLRYRPWMLWSACALLVIANIVDIAAAFLTHPDWPAVVQAVLIPRVEWSGAYWATLVGTLGTTISPYLFFWQAAQEVEQQIPLDRSSVKQREGASKRDIRRSRNDVLTGMFFSNLVMYFIVLTSAAKLHAHGKTTISTARDAVEAPRPLAGDGAYWLFSLGLIGAGMLGVPVLAGSCAHAIAEAADGAAHQQGGRNGRARERDPASLAWVDVRCCQTAW